MQSIAVTFLRALHECFKLDDRLIVSSFRTICHCNTIFDEVNCVTKKLSCTAVIVEQVVDLRLQAKKLLLELA